MLSPKWKERPLLEEGDSQRGTEGLPDCLGELRSFEKGKEVKG
jgi:hypothetical protein